MRKAIAAVILLIAAGAAALGIASSAAASTSTEHFSLISVTTNQSHVVFSAIATGRFTAGGTAVMTGKVVTLRFQQGTITLNVKNQHRTTTKYPCLQEEASSGTYTIAGGTGAYTGISGWGKSAVNLTFVDTKVNGRCSDTPAAVQAIVTASGPVSLP